MLKLRQLAGVVAIVTVAGCHGLLEVSNPTLIRSSDIANASGANAQRLNATSWFSSNIAMTVQDVAYLTDEWTWDVPSGATQVNYQPELRDSQGMEVNAQHLPTLAYALWQTSVAMPAIRAYTPDALQGDFLAQMYGIRGYLILQMAEDLCPGFPLDDVADNHTVYGGPLTTDSAITIAVQALDSAIKYAHDSSRFVTLAHVAKGRALLDLGKYTEAAAAVANIPTAAEYRTEPTGVISMSGICDGCYNTGLGNREGGTGLPFVSANDPRIPLVPLGPRNTNPSDTLYATTKGSDQDFRIVLASGIEARLIEAEAALHNGQDWKSILDSLRATVGLDPLVDPGTADGRVDLLYSERAFWLFMTGRRLGDMRRLIRNYGRTPDSVFPTGTWLGGTGAQYGKATAFPFNFADEHRFNPYITTGCTTR